MEIKVIGSGEMWTKYYSACYLIDDEILIDIPNGTCKALLGFDVSLAKIKHVLITHFHGDHFFDIPFYLLSRFKYNNEDKNVYIYADKKGIKKIKKILKLAFPNSLAKINNNAKINYIYQKLFNINDYIVEKVVVDHGNLKPAFGYILKKDNVKIGFTGDTCYCKNVEYMASICDYLFCDCTFITGNSKHMGINDIKVLSDKYKNCKFVVSHLNDDTRIEIIKNKINNVIVPEDNQTIKIK